MVKKLFVVLVLALLVGEAISTDALRRSQQRRRRRNFDATKIKAHVFTGYMDEEVTYTLQNVLKNKAQYSGVIVIERNSYTGGKNPLFPDTPVPQNSNADKQKESASWLLQRPVSTYTSDPVHVLVPVMTGSTVGGKDTMGAGWAYGSAQKLQGGGNLGDVSSTVLGNFKTAFEALFNLEATRKALHDVWSEKGNFDGQGKPKMSLTGFSADTAPAPLIYLFGQIDSSSVYPLAVVIRAFEMGLNPGAVTPSLTLAVQALKDAKVDEFSFFAIGAGGAANAEDCAGAFSFLQASWYAGVTMTGHNAVSMNLLFDQVGKADQTVADVGGDLKPQSLKAAWEARTPKKTDDTLDVTKYSVEQQNKEKTIIQDFAKDNADARIGMTYTYFGGWNSKLASNTVQGHSANMEDYHVIKAVNVFLADDKKAKADQSYKRIYPALQKEGVWRVDADPYCIKDTHKTALDSWMDTSATVSMATLVKIWKWNFDGLPLAQLSNAGGCWSMVTSGNADFKKAFIPIAGSECVPNPFLVEMAVDFWNDGAKIDSMFKDLTGVVKADTDIPKLVAGVISKSGDERVNALKVLAHYYCQRTWFIEKKANPAVSTALDAKKNSDGAAFDGDYNKDVDNSGKICPLWARDNWAIGAYFNKDQLKAMKDQFPNPVPKTFIYFAHWFKGMGADGVDRLFYKASNFPGIENLNAHLFQGVKGPIDFLSQKKTMAGRPVCDKKLSEGCPKPN